MLPASAAISNFWRVIAFYLLFVAIDTLKDRLISHPIQKMQDCKKEGYIMTDVGVRPADASSAMTLQDWLRDVPGA